MQLAHESIGFLLVLSLTSFCNQVGEGLAGGAELRTLRGQAPYGTSNATEPAYWASWLQSRANCRRRTSDVYLRLRETAQTVQTLKTDCQECRPPTNESLNRPTEPPT